MSEIEVGDRVKSDFGHEGEVLSITDDRAEVQITEEKVKMDWSDYDVDGDPIVWSHIVMDSPLSSLKVIKKKSK
jgi:preprotein translocase subunit YajC